MRKRILCIALVLSMTIYMLPGMSFAFMNDADDRVSNVAERVFAVGDSLDNIPGQDALIMTGGTALLSEYGSVEISGDTSISSLNGIGIGKAKHTVSIIGDTVTVQGGEQAVDESPDLSKFQPVSTLTDTNYDGAAAILIDESTLNSKLNTYKFLQFCESFVPVTGVTLNETTLSLYSNSSSNTSALKATVAPDNASNKTVTWSSSNTNVVTVVL